MLKIGTLFSGIGAPETALKRRGIEHNVEWFCEIDKYAVESYCAMHDEPKTKNLGDITEVDIETIPDVDMIVHGSPCQDFSVAGSGKGGDAGTGTRSSLMWNAVEIIRHTKPKYVVWENVKGVLSKKHKHNFDKYIEQMQSLGYVNHYKVLNAKDYGVPQNRERIFVVSLLDEKWDAPWFTFPEKQPLHLRLLDVLEKDVDEKYYLSDKMVNYIMSPGTKNFYYKPEIDLEVARPLSTAPNRRAGTDTYMSEEYIKSVGNTNPSGRGMNGEVYDSEKIAPTVTTNKGEGSKVLVRNRQKERIQSEVSTALLGRDYKDPKLVRIDNNPTASQGMRVYDPNGVASTQVGNAGGLGGKTGLYMMQRPHGYNKGGKKHEISPPLTVTSFSENNFLVEKQIKYEKPLERQGWHRKACEVIDPKGISTCVHTQSNNLLQKVAEPKERFFKQALETMNENEMDNGDTLNAFNKSIDKSGTSPTITTRPEGFKTAIIPMVDYRIRKLTPKEYWRLMGQTDENFEKARQALIKNIYNGKDKASSQLYKQAGNSIVVNVLVEIFRELLAGR